VAARRTNALIPEQHLPQLERERHAPLLPALPKYRQQQIVEIHVREPERQRLVDAQTRVER
jgi:hypothetical protein